VERRVRLLMELLAHHQQPLLECLAAGERETGE
jgi:hypothetical protein